MLIRRRAHHLGAIARDQARHAGHVIPVVMRQQNQVELAAHGLHRRGHGGVFCRVADRKPAIGGAKQPGVIIGQAGNRGRCQSHCGYLIRGPSHAGPEVPISNGMGEEIHGLAGFYAAPAGGLTARLLRRRLATLWPRLTGLDVLGIGHAEPYLPLWREEAARCIALAPAQLGPSRFAHGGVSSAVLAEEDALPFPDLSFDRILLVHGLEAAENAGRLLRECWRVLRDDGRLLVVAPNRRGIWAQFDHTPFGHGRPYSPGQISKLLQAQMFRVERRDAALYVPPFTPLMRAGTAWEKAGRTICPARWAGLCLIEAEKDIFAAVPTGAVRLRRRVLLRT